MSVSRRLKGRLLKRPVSLSGGVFPILFVHIPKTAGTSFRLGFEQYVGNQERLLFDYGEHANKTSDFIREMLKTGDFWPLCKRVREHSFDMLAGHLPAKNYVHMFGVSSSVTFLRDPVQRVISEYQHARRHNGYQKDFEAFIRNPRNQNKQSRLLRGVVPDALGFIGITERYGESLAGINEMLGIAIPESVSNKGRENIAEPYVLAADVRDELEALNRADIRLYNKFDELLSIRKRLSQSNHRYVHGRIVRCDSRTVSGWAWFTPRDGAPADAPVELELFRNGCFVQLLVAKEPRGDLEMLTPPRGGYVGFSCHHEGKVGDVLSFRVADSGQLLSPETVVVPSS